MSALQLSIIVPTYWEVKNIPVLAQRIDAVLSAAGYRYELIIADDFSGDGTEAVCAELAGQLPLRLLTRRENRGLSAAVLDGIAIAAGEVVLVMDADLSHPPEKLPELAELLLSHTADFVVGSRYVTGGGLDDKWPWLRRFYSKMATLPARPLVPLADPMSGFFGLRRADMPPADILSPIGYKIGLELLVKTGFSRARVREVPITFLDRVHGESKMTFREQLNYLRHLRRLYMYRYSKPSEVFQFLFIGTCGLVLDIAIYLLLIHAAVPHVAARAISYWPAVTFNWQFNRLLTFGDRPPRPRLAQWMQYAVGSGIGFVFNWGTYWLLTSHIAWFADSRLTALFIGVVTGTLVNFLISDKLVFRAGKVRGS